MALFIPNHVAPNTVTFVGFLAVVGAYLCTVYYQSNFGMIPPIVYLLNTVCLFWYQTLDAIGKCVHIVGDT